MLYKLTLVQLDNNEDVCLMKMLDSFKTTVKLICTIINLPNMNKQKKKKECRYKNGYNYSNIHNLFNTNATK